jgi:hypothetical protein
VKTHGSSGMSTFRKGHKKLGGRKKGTPNRATQHVNMAVALASSGDQETLIAHLIWLGLNQPRAYLKLLGKLL